MNILITSAGRRTKLIEEFKENFDRVVATDLSNLAPAIYKADNYYIVPCIKDDNYILTILEICKKEKIDGILSLIDPELEILSRYKEKFKEIGVTVIGSSASVSNLCFDKFKMYNFLKDNNFKTQLTYDDLEKFKNDYKNEKIKFPVFIKPCKGSASIGVNRIDDMETLELFWKKQTNLIIQGFINGEEIGCDVYTDLISKEVVSIFTKKKLNMRAGETDKAVSFKDNKLFGIVEDFIEKLGTIGPADIDIFKVKGEYYISEVNPRFGGGYLIAYECSENFPKLIRNNLEGKANIKCIGNYRNNICMLKHDDLEIVHLEKRKNGKV
ncbi:MAG: ATP-grasp domain-containing protein [Fusobacterium sp. JB021]|nr:ATP-grasp domain-containing protein [Fusobacterium sp. JB021]